MVTILPDYAMLRGYSGQHGALLMSVVGLTNTLGRVLAGWLADRATVTAISINSGALLLGGLTCLAFSATDHYTWLVAEAAVFGLCMGEWGQVTIYLCMGEWGQYTIYLCMGEWGQAIIYLCLGEWGQTIIYLCMGEWGQTTIYLCMGE